MQERSFQNEEKHPEPVGDQFVDMDFDPEEEEEKTKRYFANINRLPLDYGTLKPFLGNEETTQRIFNLLLFRTKGQKFIDMEDALRTLRTFSRKSLGKNNPLSHLLKDYDDLIENIRNQTRSQQDPIGISETKMPYITNITCRLLYKIEFPEDKENLRWGKFSVKELSHLQSEEFLAYLTFAVLGLTIFLATLCTIGVSLGSTSDFALDLTYPGLETIVLGTVYSICELGYGIRKYKKSSLMIGVGSVLVGGTTALLCSLLNTGTNNVTANLAESGLGIPATMAEAATTTLMGFTGFAATGGFGAISRSAHLFWNLFNERRNMKRIGDKANRIFDYQAPEVELNKSVSVKPVVMSMGGGHG